MTCNSAPTLSVRGSLALFSLLDRIVNVLTNWRFVGHWLFTTLLLPALFAATDASPTHEKARVVTVSSSANYLTKGLDFEAFADGPQRRKYNIWELYNKSKFVGGPDLDLHLRPLTDWTPDRSFAG
jgi:hypothetical protein